MTIEVKELLSGQKVAEKDGQGTLVLIEIIQRLVDSNNDLQERVAALEVFHP